MMSALIFTPSITSLNHELNLKVDAKHLPGTFKVQGKAQAVSTRGNAVSRGNLDD